MTASLDDLARELDRARAAADRKPGNADLLRRHLEAEVAFLRAEVKAVRGEATFWRDKAGALVRALRRRRAHQDRLVDLLRAARGRPRRRRARTAGCGPDLFGEGGA